MAADHKPLKTAEEFIALMTKSTSIEEANEAHRNLRTCVCGHAAIDPPALAIHIESEVVKDVHTEHCCSRHGCKYYDFACTVKNGEKRESFMCEECEWELSHGRLELAYEMDALFEAGSRRTLREIREIFDDAFGEMTPGRAIEVAVRALSEYFEERGA
jgi:hypothetical protein